VVMIYHMVTKDIATFFMIESVFLIAFAQTFVIIAEDVVNSPGAVLRKVQYFFAVMIGDVEFAVYNDADYITTTIFYVYVVLVSVCLLNMLIAMMGDTYDTYKDMAKDIFDLQRIMITISVEGNLEPGDRFVTDDGKHGRKTLTKELYDDDEHRGMMKHAYHTSFAGEPHIQIIEATNPDGNDRDTTYQDFVPPFDPDRALFDAIDADGDGVITAEELAAMQATLATPPATPPRGWPAAAGCMGETPGAVAVGGSDLLALHRTLQAVGDTQAQILAELRTREPTSAAHVHGSSHHNHPRLQ
jgi:hypothetical protein